MIPAIITAAGMVLLIVVLAYYRTWLKATDLQPLKPSPDEYPSVTVIRPIRGLDSGVEGNLEVALNHNYPGNVETLFVFDNLDEPAIPMVQEAMLNHPDVAGLRSSRILFCGEPPAGRTGKLNAMLRGLEEAGGKLIAFCDSDVRADRDSLTHLVDTLVENPESGSAFAPVAVTSAPKTMGDAGYALLLNGLYGPVTAAVAKGNGGELPFIMGQFMVLRRSAIERIGGLESVDGQLVDDMYIGARMQQAGLHNIVSPRPVAILQDGLSGKEFWALYTRWIMFSRTGLPGWGFRIHAAVPVALYWISLALAALAASQGWWVAAVANAVIPAVVPWIYADLHRAMGGARLGPVNRWASLFVLLLAPVIFGASYLSRKVRWRGHVYALNGQARLEQGKGATVESS